MSRDCQAIVDTDVVIALDRYIEKLPEYWALSTATFAELAFGFYRASNPLERHRRLEVYSRLSKEIDPLPIDLAVAEHYGAMMAANVMHGRPSPKRKFNMLIAATAAVHKLPLYTCIGKDYINVEDYVAVHTLERP